MLSNSSIRSISYRLANMAPFYMPSTSSVKMLSISFVMASFFTSGFVLSSGFRNNLLSVSKSSFSSFLQSPISLSSDISAVWMNSSISLTASAAISKCVFYQCSSSSSGGAVYSITSSLDIVFSDCSFISCTTAQHGGSIFIENAAVVNITRCCSFNCSAYSYQVDLGIYSNTAIYIDYHMSSFVFTTNTAQGEGNTIGGTNVIMSRSNFTESKGLSNDAAFLMCNLGGTVQMTYIAVCSHSSNISVIGLRGTSSIGVTCGYMSVANNTAANGGYLIDLQSGAGYICNNSVFVGNSMTYFVSHRSDYSASDLSFFSCVFDTALSSYQATVTTSNCQVESNPQTLVISYIHSKICGGATLSHAYSAEIGEGVSLYTFLHFGIVLTLVEK